MYNLSNLNEATLCASCLPLGFGPVCIVGEIHGPGVARHLEMVARTVNARFLMF